MSRDCQKLEAGSDFTSAQCSQDHYLLLLFTFQLMVAVEMLYQKNTRICR